MQILLFDKIFSFFCSFVFFSRFTYAILHTLFLQASTRDIIGWNHPAFRHKHVPHNTITLGRRTQKDPVSPGFAEITNKRKRNMSTGGGKIEQQQTIHSLPDKKLQASPLLRQYRRWSIGIY